MKVISIYDQYHPVYKNTSNEMFFKYYRPGEAEDTSLTLVHPQSAFETYDSLTDESMFINRITELFEQAKELGSYQILHSKLNEGFVVIRITLNDGKVFDRNLNIKTL